MITKLNKKQEKLMDEVKDKWLNKFFDLKEIDKDKYEKGIEFIYTEFLDFKKPDVYYFDSPFGLQLGLNMLKNISIPNIKLDNQVSEQVWEPVMEQFMEQVDKQVSDQVNEQVWKQVWNQVREQVENQVKNQVRKQKELEYFNFSNYGDFSCFGWVSFYDYFSNIIEYTEDLKLKFEKYKKFIESRCFMNVFLKDKCFTCSYPSFLERDDKLRLHCTSDGAIAWNDGYKQHYVHGVYFEPELFNKFFITKKYKSGDILKLRNAEQRSAIIQVYGIETVLKELNRTVIDTWIKKSSITGKDAVCELFECELDKQTLRFVKVECHTEHKFTTLGVPINEQTKTCKGAIAWTFGVDEEEYNCMIES